MTDREKLNEWIAEGAFEAPNGHMCINAQSAKQIAIAYADRRVAEAVEKIQIRRVPQPLTDLALNYNLGLADALHIIRALSPAREGGDDD